MAGTKTPAKAGQSSLLRLALAQKLMRRGFGKRYRDDLTGVPNRHYMFGLWLPAAYQHQSHTTNGLAVGFVDIDGLKRMNYMIGHDPADLTISHLAIKLDEALFHACPVNHNAGPLHKCLIEEECPERIEDGGGIGARHQHRPYSCHAVARTGGDEFIIGFFAASQQQAKAVADDIARRVSDLSHRVSDGSGRGGVYRVSLGMSVGIAWHRGWGLKRLVNAADQAMYAAKAMRQRNPAWNESVMHDAVMEQAHARVEARNAARRAAVQDPRIRESYILRISDTEDKTAGGVLRTLPRGSYHPEMGAMTTSDDVGHYGQVANDLVRLALDILRQRPDLPALYVPMSMDLLRGREFTDLEEIVSRDGQAGRIHICLHGLEMRFDDSLTHSRLEALRGKVGDLVIDGFGGRGGAMELPVLSAFYEIGKVMLHPSLIDEATRTERGSVLLNQVVLTCESLEMTPIITGVNTAQHAREFARVKQILLPSDNPFQKRAAISRQRRRMFTGYAAAPPQALADFCRPLAG